MSENEEPELGSLESLEVRDIWQDEARHFTPWLAKNLDRLAKTLGFTELKLVDWEVSVGSFYLDILAETETGDRVAIENQLAWSDHLHLGQCLTYAAGLGASIVIWITPHVRPEHRAAFDWLNEHTDDAVDFFAIEVGAVRIGSSVPAPVFNIVSKPNTWQRAARQRVKGPEKTQSLDEYLTCVAEDAGDEYVPILRSLAQWSLDNGGRIAFGVRSLYLMWPLPDRPSENIWPVAIYSAGSVEVVFQYLATRRPFDDEALREELRQRLNEISGVEIPADALQRRPSFDFRELRDSDARGAFTQALGWFVRQVRRATEESDLES